MTLDVQQAPLETAPATATGPQKKTWREQRWERRRRRIWFEELLGWILVPLIVFAAYWAIDMVLTGLGTSPAAIVNGIGAIMAY
jgi:hypothetical protein